MTPPKESQPNYVSDIKIIKPVDETNLPPLKLPPYRLLDTFLPSRDIWKCTDEDEDSGETYAEGDTLNETIPVPEEPEQPEQPEK